ncbi:MAG: PqqD family protein [Candidatus Binatus sp.]|uniref:PqqD family protein n=1 Tax=Candidatus Binatus sp. TaxID=2811406 RepID=UPI002725E704|nr:PqqD family protein [Candidatus Binatus sp.]MDO8432473.1 PqqD family protein [Candidatus Binatus sp.]
MPNFPERLMIAPDVLIREIGGESVILDLKSQRYLGLDEVGTRMWHALLESDSVQAAYDALLAEYEVEPNQLEQDIREFVDRLLENNLVSIAGAVK